MSDIREMALHGAANDLRDRAEGIEAGDAVRGFLLTMADELEAVRRDLSELDAMSELAA